MIGMSVTTGKPLDGEAHLRQSVADILFTPLGSRVARRDYGSLLPELIDQPMNAVGRLRLFAAAALALARWEPRLKLTRATLAPRGGQGGFELTLEGRRLDVSAPNARTVLTLPLRPAGSLVAYA